MLDEWHKNKCCDRHCRRIQRSGNRRSTLTASRLREYSHGKPLEGVLSRQAGWGSTLTASRVREYSHGKPVEGVLSRQVTVATVYRQKWLLPLVISHCAIWEDVSFPWLTTKDLLLWTATLLHPIMNSNQRKLLPSANF